MNKLIVLLSLMTTLQLQASWYTVDCSDAKGETILKETKMGYDLFVTKTVKNKDKKVKLDSNGDNYGLITYVESDRKEIENTEYGECNEEGVFLYNESETYASVFSFTLSKNKKFPEGTHNASEDLKVLKVRMICTYESGGAHSCPDKK